MAEKSPIPAAKKSDSEDVSWALSTADAMWGRGDRADAVKWLRRAVESASEAQDDDRALELAKAAADIASQAGIVQTSPPPLVAASAPPMARPSAPPPVPKPSAAPPRPAPTRSVPPPPPSRPAPPTAKPTTGSPPAPPRPPAQARVAPTVQPRGQTLQSGAKAPIAPVRPAAGVPAKPARRKSHASFTNEAKLAAAPSPPAPTPLAAGDVTITQAPEEITQQIQTEPKRRRASKPAAEETHDVVHAPVSATTDEMDAWPTQSLVGDNFDSDEKTRIGEPAYQQIAERLAEAEAPRPAREQTTLLASQAVRVVVWRGPDGVRVAPYGTTVNAIGVDAILVALDPNADLATWLSRK